ncbi:glycosyltransferase [Verminephrobacter aporrectodeae]|uniref:glycosyltransferase n=1 Tax=Verminephrobacter aporrectodeae TaxID=1110389 RepID=UPI002242F789|nr:hypothetical protein [Verminephrobacter aporrectodeae]
MKTPASYPSPTTEAARCFFGVTTNLGWHTMGARLGDAIQFCDAAVHNTFQPFTLPKALGPLTWSANYSDGEKVRFPILDLHASFFLGSSKLRRQASGFDAVVAATSPMAAAFIADSASPPVFQIVDGTRALFKQDFGINNISEAAIERERRHFLRVQHTFALSNWVRNSIVNDYGVPENRVSVIRPMAPCSSMAPYQPMSRQPSQRLQVAFIGGDFVRKGGDRLLSWQQEHLHSFVDLHIVTDDRFRDERIPNTLWYGSLSNSDVIGNLLPRMDVLCHPTTRDCSAIVVAEAAIVGVPSITTTVGGIPVIWWSTVAPGICLTAVRTRTLSSQSLA